MGVIYNKMNRKLKLNKKHQKEIDRLRKLIKKHNMEEDKEFEALITSMHVDDKHAEIIWDHIYNGTEWSVEYVK